MLMKRHPVRLFLWVCVCVCVCVLPQLGAAYYVHDLDPDCTLTEPEIPLQLLEPLEQNGKAQTTLLKLMSEANVCRKDQHKRFAILPRWPGRTNQWSYEVPPRKAGKHTKKKYTFTAVLLSRVRDIRWTVCDLSDMVQTWLQQSWSKQRN